MIRSLEKEDVSAGLKINCGKTKMLSLTAGKNSTIEVAGDQTKVVDPFTYLGSVIAAGGGGTDMDIETYQQSQSSSMAEQQFEHQLEVAAFQVLCSVRAAI